MFYGLPEGTQVYKPGKEIYTRLGLVEPDLKKSKLEL